MPFLIAQPPADKVDSCWVPQFATDFGSVALVAAAAIAATAAATTFDNCVMLQSVLV